MSSPRLSVIVLTWNEQANIRQCLQSLARQRERDFEVLVVDAASTDRTVDLVEQAAKGFPVPLRLHVASHRIPIGEARNLGVRMARAPFVAFLSADAEADAEWTSEAVLTLQAADMVFSCQRHRPHKWTTGAAVRGLRYHFPTGPVADALPYASNVAAAYRREVLERFPFDPQGSAAEDVVLARTATAVGYRARYNPHMVVDHHDVPDARIEWRKSVREGNAMGRWRHVVGFQPMWALWGAAVGVFLLAFLMRPSATTAVQLGVVTWFPAVRRAFRRARHMPKLQVAKGVAATPLFDLAFLVTYAAGLLAGLRERPALPPVPKEQTA
jgi:glycosyltransferase involved in cell wall biosynthesis